MEFGLRRCCDGSFYTGSTRHLPYRLWQHQNGLGSNHTSKRLPVKLVYAEKFEHVADAFYREKQVQGWSRAKKISLMQSDWDRLHILAECRNESHWQGSFDAPSASLENAPSAAKTEAPTNFPPHGRAERSRSPDSGSQQLAFESVTGTHESYG